MQTESPSFRQRLRALKKVFISRSKSQANEQPPINKRRASDRRTNDATLSVGSSETSRRPSPSPQLTHALAAIDSQPASVGSASTTNALSENALEEDSESAQDIVHPWTDWKIQDDFLQKLNNWNREYQEQTLRKVLEKVNATLESDLFKSALKFIPNEPFPAGSLVEGLVNLVLLGTKIPEAKQKVYEFSMTVVMDVTHMAEAFGKAPVPGDNMIVQCWRDLDPYRNAVNKICKWANEKLTSKAIAAQSTQEDISEFDKQLERARSAFLTISTVRIVRGMADLGERVDKLLDYHNREARMKTIKTALSSRYAENAKYEDQDKTECDEETRDMVLADIDYWVRTPSDTEHCWWITGKPAVGKSAVGITTAQCLKDRRPVEAKPGIRSEIQQSAALYGQFFVNHRFKSTTDPNRIFPTLALQLASTSPAAGVIIEKAVTAKPTIIEKLTEEQARVLFVDPISAIAQHECGMVAVVIDGVDELGEIADINLILVTRVLCEIMPRLPSNVKVLIFSRPEHSIIRHIPFHIKRLDLDTRQSYWDVMTLLQKELRRITDARGWEDWPSTGQVWELVNQANGHLGWTKIALRWIERELNNCLFDERDAVLVDVQRFGIGNLDTLYGAILHRAVPESASLKWINLAKTVLGSLAVVQEPLAIGTISALLALRKDDVLNFLWQISSVVVEGTEPVMSDTVPCPHKSFLDYITERAVSQFRIDIISQHCSLAAACFRVMLDDKQLHFNMGGFKASYDFMYGYDFHLDQHVIYACESFVHHLKEGSATTAFHADIDKFMKTQFLCWLEVLSIRNLQSQMLSASHNRVASILDFLRMEFKDADPELASFIKDMIDFVKRFNSIIVSSIPHIYISALPFATSSPNVMRHYHPNYPHTLSLKQKSPKLQKLQAMRSAAFSSDGKYVAVVTFPETRMFTAAVTSNYIIHMFDLTIGQPLWRQTLGNNRSPYPIVFSSDSKYVASGGKTLQVWSTQTGEMKKQRSISDDDSIKCLAFASDSIHIAVGSRYGQLLIYDLLSEELRTAPFTSDEGLDIAYSPDGKSVFSIDGQNFIRIWDCNSLTECSIPILRSDDDSLLSSDWHTIAISPNGSQIVLGSHDSILLFHPPMTKFQTFMSKSSVQNSLSLRHSGMSLAFSPNGRFLASGSHEGLIEVWDICQRRRISSLVGHTGSIHRLAFLPDGNHMASASKDRTIRIWNIASLLEGRTEVMDHCNVRKPLLVNSYDAVCDDYGNVLFGKFFQGPFRHPRNTLIIGECLNIDFTNFVHGNEWERCREPLNHDVSKPSIDEIVGNSLMVAVYDDTFTSIGSTAISADYMPDSDAQCYDYTSASASSIDYTSDSDAEPLSPALPRFIPWRRWPSGIDIIEGLFIDWTSQGDFFSAQLGETPVESIPWAGGDESWFNGGGLTQPENSFPALGRSNSQKGSWTRRAEVKGRSNSFPASSPRQERQFEYSQTKLARRPRDWRADYTCHGLKPTISTDERGWPDVQEFHDPVKRVLNPLLVYDTMSPPIEYNLRENPHHPNTIHFPNLGRAYNQLDLAQMATNPPTDFLRLYHPKFPWYIDIRQAYSNGITVWDVIDQVFKSMYTSVAGQHFWNEELGDEDRAAVSLAFQQRCKNVSSLIQQGAMRVDFLGIDKLKFTWIGLELKNGMWEMKTVA